MVRALQGRTDLAVMLAKRAHERWTPTGFHMQHFYSLRLESFCDLADGRAVEAWQRIENIWPQLARSNLLRHCLIRLDALVVRARAMLAVSARDSNRRPQLLKGVDRIARILEKEGRSYALAHAHLLRGLVALVRGQVDTAARHFEASKERFDVAGMRIAGDACRHALMRLGKSGEKAASVSGPDAGSAAIRIWLPVGSPASGAAR
jgi:hypothetical protein